jgi:hypothetical protein
MLPLPVISLKAATLSVAVAMSSLKTASDGEDRDCAADWVFHKSLLVGSRQAG